MQSWNTSVIYASLIVALLAPSSAFARHRKKSSQSSTAAAAQPTDQKVDISGLENKYWAPKDTDFSVVQNRAYTKKHKHFVALELGPIMNDAHSTGLLYGVNYNYFYSERYGIQATVLKANLGDNQSVKDLLTYSSGVKPNYGVLTGYYGLGFNWVPFYAKMSFLGKRILYFDMALTPTLGVSTYDQELQHGNHHKYAPTVGLDLTQFFFFSHNFAIRLDLKNQWRQEDIISYSTQPTKNLNEGDHIKNQITQDTIVLVGATYYFN